MHFFLVIAFFLVCIGSYEQSQRHLQKCLENLQEKKKELVKEKTQALQKQQSLMLAINSQSDPAFVELTLIKVLGVLPEGQVKIYINDD